MDLLLNMLSAEHRQGQQRFAEVARSLVRVARPELLRRIPDEVSLLDPLLVAYFTEPEPTVTLEQLLYGRMTPETRPARITVRTDPDGAAELPGIGTLHTDRGCASLVWEFGRELRDRSGLVSYTLAEQRHLPGTSMVLDEQISPVLHGFFAASGVRVPVIPDAGAERVRDVVNALELLTSIYPEYDRVIRQSTNRLVLFSSTALNSFATPRAHGCVFLDTAYGRGSVFHLEDLLHQCGHVAFTAMTLDTGRVLGVDKDAPIGGTDDSGEPRTAYVVLHAVVTERLMAEGLLRAITSDLLGPMAQHEAAGRLGYILIRYAADMTDLVTADILAADGIPLGARLLADLNRLVAAARPHVAGLDLSGQPYNFDTATFLARNPRPALITGGRCA
ncbi:hypothetical protein G7043_26955 [Lentzea sp. NEAU-D13]|uniref:HEXXH motif-containing protein n=1 Tax=Lentzea alba TaxID=2714351 RepID=A0A7C9RTK8_9PSEU|nr:hypothetical protein [Lentzea alba]NGY62564.1 hypothetical protein [Lentzea alba]